MEGSRGPRDETERGPGGIPQRDETESRPEAATPALADPAPLGLASFATTTFILSMINAGLVGGGTATAAGIVAPMAFAVGGIAQFIAGLWEFRNGNTFGATAFCSFGMFWLSFYLLLHVTASALPKTEIFSSIGLYLWAWGIFTAYMTVASLRTTGAVFAVFLLLTVTFILLGIGNSALAGTLSLTNNTIKIGGWVGLATAVVAWYASFAGVLNDTWGRTVLPVFPLTRGS
jgi:succinate-acetate transporter protein